MDDNQRRNEAQEATGPEASRTPSRTVQRTILGLATALPLLGAGALSANASPLPASGILARIDRIRERVAEPGAAVPGALAASEGQAEILAWHNWLNWGRWQNWGRWMDWGNGWSNWLLW